MTNKLQVLFPSSWGIRWSFQSLVGLLVAVLVIGAIYLTGESKQLLEEEDETKHQINNGSSSISQCDLFSGKWVFDNESHPLYKEKDCSFMSDQLACQKFGREGTWGIRVGGGNLIAVTSQGTSISDLFSSLSSHSQPKCINGKG